MYNAQVSWYEDCNRCICNCRILIPDELRASPKQQDDRANYRYSLACGCTKSRCPKDRGGQSPLPIPPNVKYAKQLALNVPKPKYSTAALLRTTISTMEYRVENLLYNYHFFSTEHYSTVPVQPVWDAVYSTSTQDRAIETTSTVQMFQTTAG